MHPQQILQEALRVIANGATHAAYPPLQFAAIVALLHAQDYLNTGRYATKVPATQYIFAR